MKRVWIIAAIALLSWEAAMAIGITSNVLLRTKKIIAAGASGTAFTIDVEKRQYIITAKHVVAALKAGEKIQLCEDQNKCKEYAVQIIKCDDPIDIAILVPEVLVSVTHELIPELKSAIIGQDMYFVGYPLDDYTLTTNTGNEAIGFVRKAIFSAQERGSNYTRIYLDGRNNPGFSGSAVVYIPQGRPDTEFKVAAVISGFRTGLSEVMSLTTIAQNQISPDDIAQNRIVSMRDGTFKKLNPTGNVIVDNTGIVVAYAIEHAVDAIKKSGLKGPEIK